jgi:peroxiredoxin Q/BCP
MPEPPARGDPAPAFELPSTLGEVRLSDFRARGQRLVLAFYAEDATPACTSEIAILKDAHEVIREAGAGIVAVSVDSVHSHRDFAQRLDGVPFPLASDPALSAARAYGVADEDSRRANRAVFVIDRDGTVLHAEPRFNPNRPSQVEAVFAALIGE